MRCDRLEFPIDCRMRQGVEHGVRGGEQRAKDQHEWYGKQDAYGHSGCPPGGSVGADLVPTDLSEQEYQRSHCAADACSHGTGQKIQERGLSQPHAMHLHHGDCQGSKHGESIPDAEERRISPGDEQRKERGEEHELGDGQPAGPRHHDEAAAQCHCPKVEVQSPRNAAKQGIAEDAQYCSGDHGGESKLGINARTGVSPILPKQRKVLDVAKSSPQKPAGPSSVPWHSIGLVAGYDCQEFLLGGCALQQSDGVGDLGILAESAVQFCWATEDIAGNFKAELFGQETACTEPD